MAKKSAKLIDVPIDKILPEPPQHTKYLTSLGRFMEFFSLAELTLNSVAIVYSKIDFDIAVATFVPMRSDAAIQTIKRIIFAKKLKGKKVTEIQAILSHLDKIREVRNMLMHSGSAQRHGRELVVTNEIFARSPAAIKRFNASKRTIDKMNYDLLVILYWLVHRHLETKPGLIKDEFSREFATIMTRAIRRQYIDGRGWKYVPPKHVSRRRKSRSRQNPD